MIDPARVRLVCQSYSSIVDESRNCLVNILEIFHDLLVYWISI